MSAKKPYFFVSYSRKDVDIVRRVTAELNANNIPTWLDIDSLVAGMNWQDAINDAIANAIGVIVFLSEHSTRSEFVLQEIALAQTRGATILPIMLGQNVRMPFSLASIQYLDLTTSSKFNNGMKQLIDFASDLIEQASQESDIGLKAGEITAIAKDRADQLRVRPASESIESPDSVFIVHGHDHKLRDEVKVYLSEIGVRPIVLSEEEQKGYKGLLQKFLAVSEEAKFAVVIITPDDMGAGRFQYDLPNVGTKSLKFRARQNVILELGFFYGALGFENVFILFKPNDPPFPDFERPSDIDGVPFDSVDKDGKWKNTLTQRLKSAGFVVKDV